MNKSLAWVTLVIALNLSIGISAEADANPKKGAESAAVRIDKITIASGKLDEMVKFYSNTFGVKFTSVDVGTFKLYSGKLGPVQLLLCPKKLAGISAQQNTIQLRFQVKDAKKVYHAGIHSGGKKITGIQEKEGVVIGSLRDPDGNSLELIQKANK